MMMDHARSLMTDIAAACPNAVGVSIGSLDDRTTWRVDFSDAATDAERAAAASVILTYTGLSHQRREYAERIDRDAGNIRARYITDAPGMDLTYERKRREAEYIQDGGTDESKVPLLLASVGTEVPATSNRLTDLQAVATLVLTRESQWAAIAARIEQKRLAGKKAVSEAATVDAIVAAYNAVTWADL